MKRLNRIPAELKKRASQPNIFKRLFSNLQQIVGCRKIKKILGPTTLIIYCRYNNHNTALLLVQKLGSIMQLAAK